MTLIFMPLADRNGGIMFPACLSIYKWMHVQWRHSLTGFLLNSLDLVMLHYPSRSIAVAVSVKWIVTCMTHVSFFAALKNMWTV